MDTLDISPDDWRKMKDQITSIDRTVALMDQRLMRMEQATERLAKHVWEGNGLPPLTQRVSYAETEIKRLKDLRVAGKAGRATVLAQVIAAVATIIAAVIAVAASG